MGPLDFYKRNAFMAVRQKGMIWTFVILGLVKIAALLGRGLFSK